MCCSNMCDSRQYGWRGGGGGGGCVCVCVGGDGGIGAEEDGRSSVTESLCKIKLSFSLNYFFVIII